jgi:predicted Ser/Thr protein kinase
MDAEKLFVSLTTEHDKVVAEANRQLNGMVEQYKHDLSSMVDKHNRYLERQAAMLGKRISKRRKRDV